MDWFWVSDCAKELVSGFSESLGFTFGIMVGRVRVQRFVALGSWVEGAFRMTDSIRMSCPYNVSFGIPSSILSLSCLER